MKMQNRMGGGDSRHEAPKRPHEPSVGVPDSFTRDSKRPPIYLRSSPAAATHAQGAGGG